MSIRLHPKLGLNPVLTYCCRCGGESQELILAGDARVYQCQTCKQKMIGDRAESCPKCHVKMAYLEKFTPEFGTKLPSREPCDNCKNEIEEHRRIVADGGIYWKCSACTASGVIKMDGFTMAVRAQLKIDAPKPCGVEFSQKDCPACGPKDDAPIER
jgi:hypothetical protein